MVAGFQQPQFAVPTSISPSLQGKLSVYPNPVKDLLFIQMKDEVSGSYQLIVTDINGREINDTPFTPNNSPTVELNTDSWTSGMYILRVVGKRRTTVAVYKIIKL